MVLNAIFIINSFFVLFLDYGPAVINHVLDKVGLGSSKFGKGFSLENDLEKLINALKEAEQIINEGLQKTSKVRNKII